MDIRNGNKRVLVEGFDVENDEALGTLLSGETLSMTIGIKCIPTKEKLVKKLIKNYKKSGLKPAKDFSLQDIAELSVDILTDDYCE